MIDQLVTERLVLRRWHEDDWAAFAELNADPKVMEFFPATLTTEQSDAFAERIERGFDELGFGLWAVCIDGRFAGYTGLNAPSFETPMGPHVEIGWRFARWAWGNGYASESARCVLEVAFEQIGLDVVYSFTSKANTRSEAVMKRIGMVRRSDLDFDHPNTPGWWGARHIVYEVRRAST